jgi:DNA-binding NarL/FixJ family response regulator
VVPAAAPEQVDAAEPPEDAPRRVLVVHQQATFGEALARRLSREPGLEVLGSVTRPVRAQVLVAARAVATVVLDWDLPQGASEQLALALRALDRPPVVVVLGEGEDEPSVVLRALAAGARAWVPKSASVELLLEVLRCTALGETWLSGRLLGRVLDHVLQQQREPASTSPLDVLTDRERDVLRCMVAGLGQAEIAARLFLSPNTVRTHRRRTLAKLGVHSSLEAAFVARRAGLSPHQPQG